MKVEERYFNPERTKRSHVRLATHCCPQVLTLDLESISVMDCEIHALMEKVKCLFISFQSGLDARQRKALVRGRELKGSNGLHGVFGIRFVGLNNNGSLLETVVSSEYIPRKSEILKTGHPHIARCSHPLV